MSEANCLNCDCEFICNIDSGSICGLCPQCEAKANEPTHFNPAHEYGTTRVYRGKTIFPISFFIVKREAGDEEDEWTIFNPEYKDNWSASVIGNQLQALNLRTGILYLLVFVE
jgi:hypothetical protein